MLQLEEALIAVPSLGGGMVQRGLFYNNTSGMEGVQYNITLAYAVGDQAALSVVTSGLSGIGVNTTVSEVTHSNNAGHLYCDLCMRPW